MINSHKTTNNSYLFRDPLIYNIVLSSVDDSIIDIIDFSCRRLCGFCGILPVIFVRDPIMSSIRKDIEND